MKVYETRKYFLFSQKVWGKLRCQKQKNGKVVANSKRIDLLVEKTKNRSDVTISWIPKDNARYVF